MHATTRDPEVAELLEFIIGRCAHDPEDDDGPAVCETCESIVIILARRLEDHDAGRDVLH